MKKQNRRAKYVEYSTEQIERAIHQWIRGRQNREIWRLWLVEGMTYEQIAESVDVSDKTVARCIRGNDDRVYQHVEKPA